MIDTRERLSRHLYPSGLDLSPEGVVALRISHFLGLAWVVADDRLTVTIGGSSPLPSFPLTVSFAALSATLRAAGVRVDYANADLAARSAATLVSGSGTDATPLVAFQSNLWALLDAYGVEVRSAETNLEAALAQLQVDTADGEFLDFWGEFFACPRLPGEADATYSARMVAEVLRPRNNRYAIENAVKDLTGALVSLREPWKEIFTLDSSAMSDVHAFQDGSFFTWNVFQPIFHSSVTAAERDRILAIIERNRPAGVLLVGATVQPPIAFAAKHFTPAGSAAVTVAINPVVAHYQPWHLSSSLSLSDATEDIGSAFKWTLSGNLHLIFGCDAPLGVIAATTSWSPDKVWGDFAWGKGSVVAVVTQHSV